MADQTESATAAKHPSGDPPKTSIQRVKTDLGNHSQRLLRVDQIKDRQVHFVKTAKAKPKPDRFSKTALVVRRVISRQGMVSHTEVDIRSPLLQDLFRELFKGVDGLELNKSPPIAKPEVFFWAVPDLVRIKEEEKQKTSPNQQLINDIGTALRFVEEDFASQIISLESLLGEKQITWDLLWAIFPPREVIIAPRFGQMNEEQAFNMLTSAYEERANGTKFFSANSQHIKHDGQDFGSTNLVLEIDQYEGARPISTLNFFPIKHHDEESAVRERLIARGRKYIALLEEPACRDYTILNAVREVERANGDTVPEKFNALGRVMVDPPGYYLHNSSSDLNRPWVFAENQLDMTCLSDDQLLICASWINGFSFTQKAWCQLAVTGLSDVEWNHNAFKRLVMAENRRQLIHGLVKAHRQDDASFDDIVVNKGKGLIALLTGSPGVGKTLTAEAVAEVTQRPLYVVATGELGIDPDDVDNRLGMILDITRRWGCVLLIDEADVFLSARGKDLARDALVSVFLRRLEYFRGVAILTTNRKSDIDPAFKSRFSSSSSSSSSCKRLLMAVMIGRIHFTLHYPDLDANSRQEVWKNFLTNVAKTSELSEFTAEDLAALSRHPLNGRQIKNIVSCTVSLARERGKNITVEDIETLIEVMID
ncbi:AAA family ATPase [Aspergillus sclerotiicarbonarius CBS 121057]|uniref:AAA family ATPase n=1 Tax=Aspergillus sclerotiicarbonarius (strain CBS 121057 / IBT 28362) TaxID=1448318 RepID=A0A319DSY0_ASPSB|nr:AAA family ATPase [Aspergillus sclerotiicarbonarius CBS 121057]